jgi:hypothetical protein
MKKSQRPNSLSNIKLSLKNSLNHDTKKPDIANEDQSKKKLSAYSAYQHMNAKLKHTKQLSYQFEISSSSQITERNKSKISYINVKNTARPIKQCIIV